MNHTRAIKESLIALATIAGKELNEISLKAFVGALSDLDQQAVVAALNDWIRTSKGFPYPADIRAKVMPEIDLIDNALDIANTILTAIGKDGHTNPERAKERIGELGWAVVERMGGWKHLCEAVTFENEGMFRAQIRDYAQTVSKKAKRGELNEMPSLPSSGNEIKNLIGTTMNQIGEVK